MLFTFDPILVSISVLIAVVGAYTCFDLVIGLGKHEQSIRKRLLASAAFVIGGSIWAMHFVSMLALNLTIEIQYDVLTTVISGLVSVLMTALALTIVLSSPYDNKRLALAGLVMGAGIASMHYVGMAGTRGNCIISYSSGWVGLSVVIGIVASTAAFWCAMHLQGKLRRVLAAVIMGVSIAGVHYVGMLGTHYLPADNALPFSQPIFSPFALGMLTAIAAFVILGWSLLSGMPEIQVEPSSQQDTGQTEVVKQEQEHTESGQNSLPVRKNQRTSFIDLTEIVSISADGHYTSIVTRDGETHFCNLSLTRVEEQIDSPSFFKVHRSHLVNIAHIDSFERQHDKGVVWMCSGSHQVPVSRSHISDVQRLLSLV